MNSFVVSGAHGWRNKRLNLGRYITGNAIRASWYRSKDIFSSSHQLYCKWPQQDLNDTEKNTESEAAVTSFVDEGTSKVDEVTQVHLPTI